MQDKLALGTVQFGLKYGINNSLGQVTETEVSKILDNCKKAGINTLDTAHAYGNSESVLGRAGIENFQVITKLPACGSSQVAVLFKESLQNLQLSEVYGYLIHNFLILKRNNGVWDELNKLKESGKVKKIGISLYSPEELFRLWDSGISPDLVQVPYNLFDRRFDEALTELKARGTEVHTRSAFLQGLFFKPLASVPRHFIPVLDKLEVLDAFCKSHHLDKASVCLGFVAANPHIDKAVFGVDNSTQLKHNIEAFQLLEGQGFEELNDIQVNEIEIINPSLWQLS